MKDYSRRKMLGMSAAALIVGPALALTARTAAAADMPHVDPEDAQAKALGYTPQSTKADSHCKNCQLYTGDRNAEWGTCAIFPGKEVATSGWCSAWVKQAG
jgi:hypothetical protein